MPETPAPTPEFRSSFPVDEAAPMHDDMLPGQSAMTPEESDLFADIEAHYNDDEQTPDVIAGGAAGAAAGQILKSGGTAAQAKGAYATTFADTYKIAAAQASEAERVGKQGRADLIALGRDGRNEKDSKNGAGASRPLSDAEVMSRQLRTVNPGDDLRHLV